MAKNKIMKKHKKIGHKHKKKGRPAKFAKPISKRVTRSSTVTKTEEKKSPKSSKSDESDKKDKIVAPSKEITPALEETDYKKIQDIHIQSLEREKKYIQNKKLREQNKESEPNEDDQKYKSRLRGSDTRGTPQYNMDMDSMKLESLLRDYNTQQQKKPKKLDYKPFDLPYYKGIQIPKHLKWLTIYSRTNESILMQEIEALELEVLRLKEAKLIHKEFRRYAQLPFGVMSKPCNC